MRCKRKKTIDDRRKTTLNFITNFSKYNYLSWSAGILPAINGQWYLIVCAADDT